MSKRDTEATERGRATGDAGHERGQLRLLTSPTRRSHRGDWELDEHTRQIGRAGIEAARETLRRAQPPEPFPKAS